MDFSYLGKLVLSSREVLSAMEVLLEMVMDILVGR